MSDDIIPLRIDRFPLSQPQFLHKNRSGSIFHRTGDKVSYHYLIIFRPWIFFTKQIGEKTNHFRRILKDFCSSFFISFFDIIAQSNILPARLHFSKITNSNSCQIRSMRKFHFPMIFSQAISKFLLLNQFSIANRNHRIRNCQLEYLSESLIGLINGGKPLRIMLSLSLSPDHGWLTRNGIQWIDEIKTFRIRDCFASVSGVSLRECCIIKLNLKCVCS